MGAAILAEKGAVDMRLQFQNLTKTYGHTVALDHFTATMSEGVYGILGPNGAGKSTLMNLLTDTVTRDEGEILYEGEEILKQGKAFRAVLGYMPQQQGLYEEFTARHFLCYMAGMKRLNPRQAKEQIPRLLSLVGLSAQADRKIKSFSGGMKQRVLLTQALLGDPKVLVLDEPTAGLDPEERIRIRNYISEISDQKIVLFATHVVSDIESIAEQVLLLDQGRLIRMDTPQNLIRSIAGKVAEGVCTKEELTSFQEKYRIGNVYQRVDGLTLRLVGDELPEHFQRVTQQIGLEDVYLYYLKKTAQR